MNGRHSERPKGAKNLDSRKNKILRRGVYPEPERFFASVALRLRMTRRRAPQNDNPSNLRCGPPRHRRRQILGDDRQDIVDNPGYHGLFFREFRQLSIKKCRQCLGGYKSAIFWRVALRAQGNSDEGNGQGERRLRSSSSSTRPGRTSGRSGSPGGCRRRRRPPRGR